MLDKILNIIKFENLPKWARITLWICIPTVVIAIFIGLCVQFGFDNVVNALLKVYSAIGMLL